MAEIDVNGIAARFEPGPGADVDEPGRLFLMINRENAGILAHMFRQIHFALGPNAATEIVIPAMEAFPGRSQFVRMKAS